MKTIGALLWEPGTRSGWSVEEIEIDPPKSREVRVKLAASGICHSDDHVDTGDIPSTGRRSSAGTKVRA